MDVSLVTLRVALVLALAVAFVMLTLARRLEGVFEVEAVQTETDDDSSTSDNTNILTAAPQLSTTAANACGCQRTRTSRYGDQEWQTKWRQSHRHNTAAETRIVVTSHATLALVSIILTGASFGAAVLCGGCVGGGLCGPLMGVALTAAAFAASTLQITWLYHDHVAAEASVAQMVRDQYLIIGRRVAVTTDDAVAPRAFTMIAAACLLNMFAGSAQAVLAFRKKKEEQ